MASLWHEAEGRICRGDEHACHYLEPGQLTSLWLLIVVLLLIDTSLESWMDDVAGIEMVKDGADAGVAIVENSVGEFGYSR